MPVCSFGFYLSEMRKAPDRVHLTCCIALEHPMGFAVVVVGAASEKTFTMFVSEHVLKMVLIYRCDDGATVKIFCLTDDEGFSVRLAIHN